MSQLIPITLNKIMQSKSYTVVILGTETKKFAIYTEPHVGHQIQLHLTQKQPPRPYTHDLLKNILEGFEIKPLQIVINDIEDTIYFARLFLEHQIGDQKRIVEIDARPSDCITLALMNQVPVFCRADILEKAIPIED
jgi:bifunctional DNase/RNase